MTDLPTALNLAPKLVALRADDPPLFDALIQVAILARLEQAVRALELIAGRGK